MWRSHVPVLLLVDRRSEILKQRQISFPRLLQYFNMFATPLLPPSNFNPASCTSCMNEADAYTYSCSLRSRFYGNLLRFAFYFPAIARSFLSPHPLAYLTDIILSWVITPTAILRLVVSISFLDYNSLL